MPVLLAHGALGPFDEIIFFGIGAIFLVAMGISWVRSRFSAPPAETPDDVTADESEPESTDHVPLK